MDTDVFHLEIRLADVSNSLLAEHATAQDVARVLRDLASQLDDTGPVPGAGYLHSDGANVGHFTIRRGD